MKKDKTKVNISLTIDECYGILTVINKHRTSSETIIYGSNNELETSAYQLNLKFTNIIVNQEDKERRKKEIREEEEKFKMFPNYETSKEREERRKEELNK
jgi:hypothetical protein